MDERYIAAVDMGTAKIALTVARISGEDVQILYYKERPSAGIRNSAVFNPKKAADPVKEAIAEAESELNIKIMQVVVGLPRCDIRQEVAKARVDRTNPDESITKEEVESLKMMAQNDYPIEDPEKEELYGAVAQSFSDDEEFQLIENDIIGVISQVFEGNFKLFIGKKSSIKTIDKIFNDLDIAIASRYFTPNSQAKAVLTEDEMSSGVALIDFGAGATSVTIYQGKILRFYASIPFGGNSITHDISNECHISERLAENIKLAFGACMPEKLQTLGEKIIQIEGDDMDGLKQIPVHYLSDLITCRVREIVEAMLYEIQISGLADNLRSGVVITGGGAKLTNIANYIKEISGYNVRTGVPRNKFSASGCPGVKDPSASTSIGMILSAKEDNLINCITAPETPVRNAAVEIEKPVERFIEEETQEPPVDLFGGTVPEEKKEKPAKQSKPSSLIVTWQKLMGKIDNLSKDIDEEEI
ncbi:MAG: cell division protein FtsA [Bacteroidales bacterium]|nr:cell division protein FtsA [Bacteroidales bacterium]